MEINNISKKYKYQLFSNIKYEFKKNNIYSIFGKNGIGKTTLLNIIAGFINTDSGAINYKGYENEIMFIDENPIPFELLSGEEFIIMTLKFKNLNIELQEIHNLFKLFEMFNYKDSIISTYSKGMKYKLLIILIKLTNPKILILDEPLNEVDIITLEKVRNLFYNMKKDRIIIFSTHIPDMAFKLSDTILYLTHNKLIEKENCFNSSNEIEKYIFDLMNKKNINN
ncbi:ABC transporter ATP-binding protein [Clostridium sporogenes]|uniref:ABC transporter ATP-binding protein n=1 Tax=Clostridium sporogenes TaxID=1509 RepID=A0AAE4FNW5_CLOSG|nr:ABC transporter ATP-binding protein [Clostridium sporogenes]MDS1005224.1 ABC transporter ATP-binding protein [Clostridium sporogenes]